jgi:hypothetical protein
MKRDVGSSFSPELDIRCRMSFTILQPLIDSLSHAEYPDKLCRKKPEVVTGDEAIAAAYSYLRMTPCSAFILREGGCQLACISGRCKSPDDERLTLVEPAVAANHLDNDSAA